MHTLCECDCCKLNEENDKIALDMSIKIKALERRNESIKKVCYESLNPECTCNEAYTSRKLRDPGCEYCNIGKYIFDELEKGNI